MNTFIIALILFALTYVLLFTLPKYRAYVALGSAVIFTVWLSFICKDVEYGLLDSILGIDFNVLMMIAGTMGIVTLFIESKMPMLIADVLLSKFKSVKTAIVAMAFLSGIVSAFVDNVATVLMIAPVALAFCKKVGISPVPSIICIAVSSNLQGAATLVGDTTSILLAKAANLDFSDFFVHDGRIGMFWVVQAGAVVSAFIIYLMFRKENNKIEFEGRTKVEDKFPTFLLVGTVLSLIAVSFIPYKDTYKGLVSEPMIGAIAHSVVIVECADENEA